MLGTVIRIESKDYYVSGIDTGKVYRCSLRGKFKKDFHLKKEKQYALDIAVIGDDVEFLVNADGTGVIDKIGKRKNYLSRKAPRTKGASYRGERLEQIIAANIDYLIIVSSVDEPVFNNRVIDRFLVTAESSNINSIIVINKLDLGINRGIKECLDVYKQIGYPVIKTSTIEGKGIQTLKKLLKRKRSLFWGQSGVGKSSLLNTVFPKLNLSVGEISSFNLKGKHTTVTSSMIEVEKNTFIIDTPGIREIDPFGIRKEDLGHYFIEFAPFISGCKYNTCTHNHEPQCGVEKAFDENLISAYRYESYLRLLETIEEDILF